MNDSHEIIITTRENPDARVVHFSQLFDQQKDITSMMHLWNANSYYVDVASRTFIINGGRKMVMNEIGECSILYRRRNSFEMGVNSTNPDFQSKKVNWIVGIVEIGTHKKILLQIAEDGHEWMWSDKL